MSAYTHIYIYMNIYIYMYIYDSVRNPHATCTVACRILLNLRFCLVALWVILTWVSNIVGELHCSLSSCLDYCRSMPVFSHLRPGRFVVDVLSYRISCQGEPHTINIVVVRGMNLNRYNVTTGLTGPFLLYPVCFFNHWPNLFVVGRLYCLVGAMLPFVRIKQVCW